MDDVRLAIKQKQEASGKNQDITEEMDHICGPYVNKALLSIELILKEIL